MNLFRSETPEKVSVLKDDYIKNQIDYENLKYRNYQLQQYVVEHKHIDRNTIGALLGLSREILEKGGIDNEL